MTEVLRRPAGSYREKTLVLCQFKYLTKDHRGSVWVPDALMLQVEFSDQIERAFWDRIGELQKKPWAPRMGQIEFVSYLSASGKEKF